MLTDGCRNWFRVYSGSLNGMGLKMKVFGMHESYIILSYTHDKIKPHVTYVVRTLAYLVRARSGGAEARLGEIGVVLRGASATPKGN